MSDGDVSCRKATGVGLSCSTMGHTASYVGHSCGMCQDSVMGRAESEDVSQQRRVSGIVIE